MRALCVPILSAFLLNVHLFAQSVTDLNDELALQSVFVGDPGNTFVSEAGSGSVDYSYYIGKYPVTNAQYAVFLNAVAATDTHELYQTGMGEEFGGITRSGVSGSYTYLATRPNAPVNFVSFFSAARFANWLTKGRPIGAQDATTTESGMYDMSVGVNAFGGTASRNETLWAQGGVGISRMDEWVKAAYYDPTLLNSDGTARPYWLYPTQSNSEPAAIGPNDTNPNSANYGTAVGNTTDVGSYSLARSYYGTYDQGGNVFEIVPIRGYSADDILIRVKGGAFNFGTFNFGADTLSSTVGGFSGTPASTSAVVGFRLTSLRPLPIPGLIVTTTQDIVDPNDGQISLREAIAYASTLSNQPIIHFSNHVARGAVNFYDGTAHEITLSGTELLITADMKIEGPGSKFLSINGNGDDRIFHIVTGQTVTLTGLTLFDGLPESQGGAILNEGILTLDRLSLLENGLILDEEPDPPAPFYGGAICNTGILTVTNSTFADNGAVDGGAIYNDGVLSIINSTFADNGGISGGAVYNDGVLSIINSTFAYNDAISGGAIYNEGTMTMTHVTFASNTADVGGGLLLTTPVINTAIKNSLIVDPIAGLFTDFGNNLFTANASDAGLQVDGFGDPVLADNGGETETIALLPQSPALFAAAQVTEIKTDQRGVARSQGAAPDIGAYEAETNVVVTLSGITPLFDGSPKAATVTTAPEPLDVLVTYDGSTLAPTEIGSYNVVALVLNPGLIGRAEGTLEIREIPSLIVTTSQDGLQMTDKQTSLREALLHAATLGGPQTITFSDTVDLGATNFHDGSTRTIALNGSPLIASSAVDIQGPGAERLTVSGEGLSRVFFFSGAFESTLSGVTITNGYAEGSLEFGLAGGGVNIYYGTVTLNHCILKENRSFNDGGAVGIYDGRAILNHCVLSGNTAGSDGGAIYNLVADLILNNSTVSGNTASGDGGGIAMKGYDATATLMNSTISNNTAERGGGLYTRGVLRDSSDQTNFQIHNTTFSGNSASIQGGAIENEWGVISITQSTLTGNSAPDGGGLHASSSGASSLPSLTRIANSIIAGNNANDLASLEPPQSFVSLGYNVIGTAGANVDFSLDFNQPGDQTNVTDPLLGPLAENGGPTLTHALLVGSPAINAAIAIDGLTTDQRGIPRPQGPAPDSGAFEAEILSALTTTVTQLPTLNTESGLIQSRVTITNPNGTTLSGFVLRIANLPADVQVYNATGSDQGQPAIVWRQPLASGESTEFLIEFYRTNQDSAFTPAYEAEYILLPSLPSGEEMPFVIDQVLSEGDGGFVLEWTAEPGKTYEVEYSSDLVVWSKVSPAPTAVSNRVRWRDQGPPLTESIPGTAGKRFYRIVYLKP